MDTLIQDERFDIYNERKEWQGTAPRREVHREGYWHETFHCWIWRQGPSGPELLFQQRHPEKDTFPGLLDISCAGHLLAGEKVEQGVRELAEELGLKAQFEDLTGCGVYRSEKHLPGGGWDREFCNVFLLRCDQSLTDYQLQIEELTGLYAIPLHLVQQLVADQVSVIKAEGVVPVQDQLQRIQRSFKPADFVPHDKDYYKLVLHHLSQAVI
jgi:isopentenyldiphosphate isomerase